MNVASRDVRAWICWGLAALVPALMIRNPYVLLELMIVVFVVRQTCVPPHRLAGVGWIVRIAPVLLAIGVVFNVLTVRSGNHVLATIPESLPLIGGNITLNALLYGVVGAVALFTLILIGTTVSALVRWIELSRILPARLVPFAVAGSVAWVFLPQLNASIREIREAHLARGLRLKGVRSMLPILVPLLAGGLDRAIVTAEALEARGFGGSSRASEDQGVRGSDVGLIVGLVALLVAVYGLVAGIPPLWIGSGLAGLVVVGMTARSRPAQRGGATRYRVSVWARQDSAIVVGSGVVLAGLVWRWTNAADRLIFDPYPNLAWPLVDLPTMIVLTLLLIPALLASPASDVR